MQASKIKEPKLSGTSSSSREASATSGSKKDSKEKTQEVSIFL